MSTDFLILPFKFSFTITGNLCSLCSILLIESKPGVGGEEGVGRGSFLHKVYTYVCDTSRGIKAVT